MDIEDIEESSSQELLLKQSETQTETAVKPETTEYSESSQNESTTVTARPEDNDVSSSSGQDKIDQEYSKLISDLNNAIKEEPKLVNNEGDGNTSNFITNSQDQGICNTTPVIEVNPICDEIVDTNVNRLKRQGTQPNDTPTNKIPKPEIPKSEVTYPKRSTDNGYGSKAFKPPPTPLEMLRAKRGAGEIKSPPSSQFHGNAQSNNHIFPRESSLKNRPLVNTSYVGLGPALNTNSPTSLNTNLSMNYRRNNNLSSPETDLKQSQSTQSKIKLSTSPQGKNLPTAKFRSNLHNNLDSDRRRRAEEEYKKMIAASRGTASSPSTSFSTTNKGGSTKSQLYTGSSGGPPPPPKALIGRNDTSSGDARISQGKYSNSNSVNNEQQFAMVEQSGFSSNVKGNFGYGQESGGYEGNSLQQSNSEQIPSLFDNQDFIPLNVNQPPVQKLDNSRHMDSRFNDATLNTQHKVMGGASSFDTNYSLVNTQFNKMEKSSSPASNFNKNYPHHTPKPAANQNNANISQNKPKKSGFRVDFHKASVSDDQRKQKEEEYKKMVALSRGASSSSGFSTTNKGTTTKSKLYSNSSGSTGPPPPPKAIVKARK